MSGGNWHNYQNQPNYPQDGYGQPQQRQGYGGYNQPPMRNPRQQEYPSPYQMQNSYRPQEQQFYRQNMNPQQNYMMQQHQHPQPYQHPPNHQFVFNTNASVFVPRMATAPPQEYGGSGGGYYGGAPIRHDQMQQQQYYQQHSHNYGIASAPSSSYNQAMYPPEDPGVDAFAQFGQQSQQYMPSNELYDQIVTSKSQPYLNEILVGCEQLISEGEEDSPTWIAAIRQRFEDPKMDDESKKVGVKLILEMAYSMEPNQFRGTDPQHTFSNLLRTLTIEVKDFLRNFIVPALQEFHSNRKQLENDSRVYMAVFFAEVFTKLTLENGSRFEQFGLGLADQIDEILKFPPKDEYMKCLLRAFKVAGAEMDVSEALRRRVDSILTTMGAFANGSPQLGESVKAQILSLIECRQRGWDRVAASGGVAPRSVANRLDDSFDDSLDNDLTEEERQFLESHLDQQQSSEKDEETEEDPEMMKEFGKFVKEELQQAEDLRTAEMMTNMSVNDAETGGETPTSEEK